MANALRNPWDPREGDTLVTLTLNDGEKDRPVEERMYLLSYAFAKAVQGAVLRQVLTFDLIEGCVRFVVGGGAADPGPRGTLLAKLEDWPVRADSEPIGGTT